MTSIALYTVLINYIPDSENKKTGRGREGGITYSKKKMQREGGRNGWREREREGK